MVHEPLSIQCYHGHYFFFGVPIKSFCQNEITVLKRTQSFQENILHKSFYKNLRLETT